MKTLVNILCFFVPRKAWRKAIKRKLLGIRNRRRKLLAAGFRIEDGIITTPEGVRVDTSSAPREAMSITKEVFLNRDYSLGFGCNAVVIDIGMNRGIASLFFACQPNIELVYSFEPFTPTFELAQKNLSLNPQLNAKITASNFGLGKADATLELGYMDNATGGMSTSHDVCHGRGVSTETVVIKDAAKVIGPILAENSGRHIVVKCDCEGSEFDVFERLHAENLVSKMDVVMMEYHFEKPDRLVDILMENGFAVQTRVLSSKMKTGYIYAVRMGEK